jgi:hypothetical protein
MAVAYPAFIENEASMRTGLCSGSEVGYLNVTLLKLIAFSREIL